MNWLLLILLRFKKYITCDVCLVTVNFFDFVIMGKLDVTILRYLTSEDFRVLTAVSSVLIIFTRPNLSSLVSEYDKINQSNVYRSELNSMATHGKSVHYLYMGVKEVRVAGDLHGNCGQGVSEVRGLWVSGVVTGIFSRTKKNFTDSFDFL